VHGSRLEVRGYMHMSKKKHKWEKEECMHMRLGVRIIKA
jgi:hypothetical protein